MFEVLIPVHSPKPLPRNYMPSLKDPGIQPLSWWGKNWDNSFDPLRTSTKYMYIKLDGGHWSSKSHSSTYDLFKKLDKESA